MFISQATTKCSWLYLIKSQDKAFSSSKESEKVLKSPVTVFSSSIFSVHFLPHKGRLRVNYTT